MTKSDRLFLSMIIFGLSLGLVYVFFGYGWDNAILYTALAFFAAGVIGGMRT